jgi:two-component system chemotaxis response regulator CheY
VLNDIGFKDVSLADDGATALPMLKNGNFGLLITDWNMPQMEGIDLVKAVRADPRIKSTPILMVTAEAKREQIIQAAQAGVNDYIVKPFTPDTLKAKIEKIFKALAK